MRNNKLIYGVGLLLLAIAIFYIGSDLSSGSFFKKKNRDGAKIITDSITTTSLNSLVSNATCEIELIESDQERVVFTYDNGFFKNKSKFSNGELNIDFDSDNFSFFQFGPSPEIKVVVYCKSLSKIAQSGVGEIFSKDTLRGTELQIVNDGVGDIKLNVAISNQLTATNDGVGDIELRGTCQSAKLTNQGTGDILASNLNSKNATVLNDGVGDISVMATDTLHLSNEGTGDIEYSGNAHIATMKSDGVGEIKKK